MDGRLSSSVLLRQIIPKVKATVDVQKTEGPVCSIRNIAPVELIASEIIKEKKIPIPKPSKDKEIEQQESKINQSLINRLDELKELEEFNTIIKGAKLGLTAYQKPKTGIPKSDLSKDIQVLLDKIGIYVNNPPINSLAFGQVTYDKATRRMNFYSAFDLKKTTILGSVELPKIPKLVVDKVLSVSSNNAIANSTVTNSLHILEAKIPDITVYNETLNIEKNTHG